MFSGIGDASLRKKMKRVPLASWEPRALDEEVKVRFKHQSLLQEFLELQKVRVFFLGLFFFSFH